ncbi:MAG: hypothetical protein MJ160_01680 [Treponema sp.]|nr:hypothetical protein [Treponema sp.]
MNIEESKIKSSILGTDFYNFLMNIKNTEKGLNPNVDLLFEKMYPDFDLNFTNRSDFDSFEDEEDLIVGFNKPLFDEEQCNMFNMPFYDTKDSNVKDTYLHETGHMIIYYMNKKVSNKTSINKIDSYFEKLKKFIENLIRFYDENELPKVIRDFFENEEYKSDSNVKFIYEALSDIVTSITRGKYFNAEYHRSMNENEWESNLFLIYGHNKDYYTLPDNITPNIDNIISELLANYISICLLTNEKPYYLLKEISVDNQNLHDILEEFFSEIISIL